MSNYATDVSPIVFDIETCGLPNAADYLDPCVPDARLKDPDKIAADIDAKISSRNEKLALDWNVGRIVAVGWWTQTIGAVTRICENEDMEAVILMDFWQAAKHRTLVGFNIKAFDLKFMIQRSRYLGVTHPDLDLGKYAKRGIEDLFSLLTFNDGTYDQGAMRRSLKAFAKRFGLPVNDDINGKDIPALVAAGEWEKVAAHVASDVELTLALARRLGVIQPEAVSEQEPPDVDGEAFRGGEAAAFDRELQSTVQGLK